jgi:hypothetical protein
MSRYSWLAPFGFLLALGLRALLPIAAPQVVEFDPYHTHVVIGAWDERADTAALAHHHHHPTSAGSQPLAASATRPSQEKAGVGAEPGVLGALRGSFQVFAPRSIALRQAAGQVKHSAGPQVISLSFLFEGRAGTLGIDSQVLSFPGQSPQALSPDTMWRAGPESFLFPAGLVAPPATPPPRASS